MRINKKLLSIGLIGFTALLILVVWVTNIVSTLNLEITAPEGSQISISATQGGDFEELGTSSASFKTKDAGFYFIKVEQSSQTTIKGVNLVEDTEVNISLKPTSTATKAFPEALGYPLFDGGFVYGINPGVRQITYKTNDPDKRPEINFIGVPYARKVFWQNKNSFAYLTYGDGVEARVNGSTSSYTYPLAYERNFHDLSKHKNKPLIFVDGEGVYKASRVADFSLEKIYSFNERIYPKLFTSNNEIFVVIENSTVQGEELSTTESATVIVLNYQGKEMAKFNVSLDSTVENIINIGNTYVVQTQNQTIYSNDVGNIVSDTPTYFLSSKEILKQNNTLYYFNDLGVWELNQDLNEFYLLYRFSESQKYVKDSSFIEKGVLNFGLDSTENSIRSNINVNTGFFRINL